MEVLNPATRDAGDIDAGLWTRIQLGNEEAFASLYDQWVDRVYSIATHLLGDADEVEAAVEQTFTQVWREARQYERSRGSVGAWIILIAREAALSRRGGGPRNG